APEPPTTDRPRRGAARARVARRRRRLRRGRLRRRAARPRRPARCAGPQPRHGEPLVTTPRSLLVLLAALAGAAGAAPAASASALRAPSLQAPAPDAVVDHVPAVSWGRVAHAGVYEAEIAADRNFGSVERSVKTQNTAATV